jgi:hypothetical protein
MKQLHRTHLTQLAPNKPDNQLRAANLGDDGLDGPDNWLEEGKLEDDGLRMKVCQFCSLKRKFREIKVENPPLIEITIISSAGAKIILNGQFTSTPNLNRELLDKI